MSIATLFQTQVRRAVRASRVLVSAESGSWSDQIAVALRWRAREMEDGLELPIVRIRSWQRRIVAKTIAAEFDERVILALDRYYYNGDLLELGGGSSCLAEVLAVAASRRRKPVAPRLALNVSRAGGI
ncbi:MAG TPA: hypothetical protein VE974_04625 [Thermoanaerobaculia bacterium]|nr:hypothetical protein [Thermoanaerobaculia bacterium]